MPMDMHWSARDITFVHECRRVQYFREFCRPCLIRKGAVVSHTIQCQRTHEFLLSVTVRSVVPTETNYSRMLCLKLSMMKVHRILRHCFKGVQVWFAQLGNLMIYHNSLERFTFLTQVKDGPHAIVHEHVPIASFMEFSNLFEYSPEFEHMFPMM